MARGSTRSKDVNELTKQIIAKAVSEEYAAIGIQVILIVYMKLQIF